MKQNPLLNQREIQVWLMVYCGLKEACSSGIQQSGRQDISKYPVERMAE
jgi:hypothetical protein